MKVNTPINIRLWIFFWVVSLFSACSMAPSTDPEEGQGKPRKGAITWESG